MKNVIKNLSLEYLRELTFENYYKQISFTKKTVRKRVSKVCY